MSLNIRRVVTANDDNGKARVWIDGEAANVRLNRPLVSSVAETARPPELLAIARDLTYSVLAKQAVASRALAFCRVSARRVQYGLVWLM